MDKLRVGGPCVFMGQRAVYPPAPAWDSSDQPTPAPFIPGDVVEHGSKPEWGRGLVFHAANFGDGDASVYVRWQGIERRENVYYAQPSSPSEDAAHLTLILPAQPAQEARDAR